MKIAAAQIEATIGDIKGNLKNHLAMIKMAAENEVDLIIFPEMSLTGYCREEGKDLAIKPSHPAMIKLKEEAQANNLTMVIGAPIELNGKLFIGSYILLPNGEIKVYTKQYLHTGEDKFYASSFDFNPQIKIGDEIISFAICADIDNEKHPTSAKNNQSTLYLPSIFFSKNGIAEGHRLLSQYAGEHSLSILMSNYSGNLWGTESGGKSAFWDNTGKAVTVLDAQSQGLLIMEKQGENWVKAN